MIDLLIKNVIFDGSCVNIAVKDGIFSAISRESINEGASDTIDGRGTLAILPPFYNMHTHSAMTLMRGYADDLELFPWLNEHIWPLEAKLNANDIRIGTRLAVLEMIKSGCVFCNDSYWHQVPTVDVCEEMNFRAAIGKLYICGADGKVLASNIESNIALEERMKSASKRIELTLTPHAIYTVRDSVLREIAAESESCRRRVHIHVAETAKEVEDCRKEHNNMIPVEYLDSLGLINERTIIAHAVHPTDRDIAIIAEKNALISHQPVSNIKLASGLFRFEDALRGGCRIAIGTDGCASNNNLSLYDEMKFAAMSAKIQAGSPTAGKAGDIWQCATKNSADGALGAGVGGEIAVGKVADAQLIDIGRAEMTPNYNLISNLVYSANTSVVDSVICDGRVLMRDGRVPGEEDIIGEAADFCRTLYKRQ
jgi:5-methylthioadenosine/S-adenosylhomocysteine deaminase